MTPYSLVLGESFAHAVKHYDGSEASRDLMDGLEAAFRGQKQLETDAAWNIHEYHMRWEQQPEETREDWKWPESDDTT